MPDTHQTTTEAAARLRADLRLLIQDTEQLLKATVGHTGESADQLRQRLKAALASAQAAYHGLGEKAVAAAKSADQVVRRHPYRSIGLAFGVGLLLGVLLRRR
jgi:ElaB/YqjD/DUF883 family membrane-anchored ribosome-binding protein